MIFSPEQVSNRKLQTLPLAQLRALCGRVGVSAKGRGAELVVSLLRAQVAQTVIDDFIRSTYRQAKMQRGYTHDDIHREVSRVEAHVWGTVQGELDRHIQTNYVRKFYRYDELLKAVTQNLQQTVTNYVLATWYNHWTTVVIEDIIAEHPAVIPTIKKVKETDLFWLGQPWDLKHTNLPREWFKDGYTLEDAMKNPVMAEEYLYRLQGAQRFGANNRLFLIMADSKRPDETWKLKRDFRVIAKAVKEFFDTTTTFDEVSFVYNKKPYVAHSKILFIMK